MYALLKLDLKPGAEALGPYRHRTALWTMDVDSNHILTEAL